MSRIGKMPVAIPAGVEVTVADGNLVTVKGPKGTLTQQLQPSMTIKQEGAELLVSRPDDGKENRALHGLTRALLHNMVVGVTDGYKKTLEVNGVGYRAAKEGNKLVLNIGYSHTVEVPEIDGITIEVPQPNQIVVSGCDKQKVCFVQNKILNIIQSYMSLIHQIEQTPRSSNQNINSFMQHIHLRTLIHASEDDSVTDTCIL